MSSMVTFTQNDNAPELLAHAARGPCAIPTEREMIRYLLIRSSPKERKPQIHTDAMPAVLSHRRRVHQFKNRFLRPNSATPLGIIENYWDRVEEQTRKALHNHIPFWCRKRNWRVMKDKHGPLWKYVRRPSKGLQNNNTKQHVAHAFPQTRPQATRLLTLTVSISPAKPTWNEDHTSLRAAHGARHSSVGATRVELHRYFS